MRKMSLLIFTITVLMLLLGCTKITSSTDLIYDSDKIDVITTEKVTGVGTAEGSNLNDKEKVREIVDLLKNIDINELSAGEEKKFFNRQNWSERVQYMLTLVYTEDANNTDPTEAYKGVVTVLADGNLMFSDPKTIGPFENGEAERTVSYISTEKQVDIINKILEIVDKN